VCVLLALPLALACGRYIASGPNPVDEPFDAAPVPDAAPARDSAGGVDATRADVEARACPSDMVFVSLDIGAFCIDAHEVSRSSYDAFVTAKGADYAGQRAECASNQSYAPTSTLVGGLTMPVVGIDFCDAAAYCAWAGKRLCGGIGGAPLPYGASAVSEWEAACSAGQSKKYPYGASYVAGLCAVENAPVRSTAAATLCEGGYPGLFEMVGNVWEYTDTLPEKSDAGRGADLVYFYGGGNIHPSSYDCNIAGRYPRQSAAIDVGVRCCK
jgi:formylglycine-generating enzyme